MYRFRLGALAMLTASCCGPQDAPRGGTATPSPAQRSTTHYEQQAIDTKDPVAVWLSALKEPDAEVVQSAINVLAKSKDERAIEPLRRVAEQWKPKASHDSPPIADAAFIAVEQIEADVLWEKHVPGSLSEDKRIERALALWMVHMPNDELQWHFRKLFYASDDVRIIPYLLWDVKKESSDKLQSFGQRAAPYLLDAIRNAKYERVRQSAIANAGIMKIGEAIPLLLSLLEELTEDLLYTGPRKSELVNRKNIIIWSLSQFGEPALDPVAKAVGHVDALVRESAVTVVGQIAGPRALSILKAAREAEAQRQKSKRVHVLEAIDYWVAEIQRGKK